MTRNDVVLKRLRACSRAPGGFGVGAGWVADLERPEICHLEFYGDSAALLLAIERRADHLGQVVVERRGARGEAALGVIALKEALLVVKKSLLVGVMDQRRIGERVHQGVVKRHP
jgi:hypothetical protein